MKNTSKLTIALAVLGMASAAYAQTWSLYGNYISGHERIGTKNERPLNLSTYGVNRMSITSKGQVGIGTSYPNARQEINYCPPSGQKENGLIVTLNQCNNGFYDIFNPNDGDELERPEGGSSTSTSSFLTGHTTTGFQPLFDANHAPLFWLRKQTPPSYFDYLSGYTFDTKMIVTPQGNCGINVVNPRAALDVRGSQLANTPTAIFGVRVASTTHRDPNTGLTQYYTQQVQFVPVLKENGYNAIVKEGDQGMFFSDGRGTDGANNESAFILAPWSEGGNPDIGGMRMDAQGNVGIGVANTQGYRLAVNGDITANGKILCKDEFKVQEISVAWPDYIFKDYAKNKNLPLTIQEMEEYVLSNHHLPEIPSEQKIKEEGFNMVENYTALLRQVEMLSLQIIELNHKLNERDK